MRHTYEAIFQKAHEGGYLVQFPDIPVLFTQGDDLRDAIDMAADLLELWIVSEEIDGRALPEATFGHKAHGNIVMAISVYPRSVHEVITSGVTTTEAASRLGVSQSRVRQMIAAGQLTAEKAGRDNLVSVSSINARLKNPRRTGRPRKMRESVAD
ncbi:MAG: type II toxin-antitoxin system HicB family antitoxin [Coriobacteriia bacterium]|nr:type II toxin-antitoxin system HicB family antitoxin [Coriobacteriia bacterium]